MKTLRLPFLVAFAALLVGSGCGTLDLSSGGDPNRVLKGVVSAGELLPAGAEILVRIMAPVSNNDSLRTQNNEVALATRPSARGSERVLGESTQRLAAGTIDPVPFQIEYNSDDAELRRGLVVEARVSVNGKVRYRTISAHVITLASSPFRQEVSVQPVSGN